MGWLGGGIWKVERKKVDEIVLKKKKKREIVIFFEKSLVV
jgi:hypothetical protein